jgi:hypothetical protein
MRAGRKLSEHHLSWCPESHRAEYRRLVRSKLMRAADAKAKILAGLTSFERAMHAVSRGAGLITVQPIRRKDYDFTLGGVTDL